MNFGVKRFKCRLVTASIGIFLVTFSFPVKSETINENNKDLVSNFSYESITNNLTYQDLQDLETQENREKIKEKSREEILSISQFQYTLNYLKDLKPETDYLVGTNGISNSYPLEKLSFLSSDNSALVSEKKSSILLADEPLPPSEVGLYWSPARPDSHAPIGVMGEHIHSEGEVMVSYRYMLMEMDGSLVGTDDISDEKILEQFPVTPTRMTMQMHMFGIMYGVTSDFTLMAMLPYVVKDMDHITRTNRRFNTDSEGIGDIKLTGLYQIFNDDRQRIHLNAGISIPSGSIEARDRTPAGPDQLLPYPMQLGSGTLDLQPGFTYLGQTDNWSWGTQIIGTLRLGENSNSYKFGDEIMLTAWGSRKWSDWASTSLRIKGKNWGNISGKDSRLNPSIVPTADPTRRGGTQIDIGFGINLFVPEGDLRSGRLAIEFDVPIYRALSGPQLETDWQLTAGLQFTF